MQWARKAIFSFSFAPLEWIFYLALVSVLISLLAAVTYLIIYIFNPSAPRGFMTTLFAVLLVGSIQLISLAIISEYLRRIFEEVKARPPAITRSIINPKKRRGQ